MDKAIEWEEKLQQYTEPRYQQKPVMDFWDEKIIGVATEAIPAGGYLRSGPDGNIRLKQVVAIDDEDPQIEEEDICDEAKRITTGERQHEYGPPTGDFGKIAAMWSALFGREFSRHEVALAMVCLKLSRLSWSPEKRDSWTDGCGYLRCGWLCVQAEIENGEL